MTATVPGTREFVCLSICLSVCLSLRKAAERQWRWEGEEALADTMPWSAAGGKEAPYGLQVLVLARFAGLKPKLLLLLPG
jgi:hypothetical protein